MRTAGIATILVGLTSLTWAQVYVSPFGDNSTGDSWATAFFDVVDGVAQAESLGEDVWIAEATYNIQNAISVPTGMAIYGGFPPSGNPGFGDRDPEAHPTVLDGLFSSHIFNCDNATGVHIEGLEFTRASFDIGRGGAIRSVNNSDVTITQCTFYDNTALNYGGGVFVEEANATITFCEFRDNFADEAAAIMLFTGSATVSDCTFVNNDGGGQGGAILTYESPITIERCYFEGNIGARGGAMTAREGMSTTIVNSLFVNNSSSNQGAGLNFEFQDDIDIANCTFVDNTAGVGGGGLYFDNSNGFATNCVFVNNNKHAIYEGTVSGDCSVDNSLFFNNPDGVYFDEALVSIATAEGPSGLNILVSNAANNLDGDPVFVDPVSFDYHIRASSAAIGAGTVTGAPVDDFDLELRDASVDIGFDEYVDTDADGLPDYWELQYGLDPGDGTGVNGADGDLDGDGASNTEEYEAGTKPDVADTDGDGVNDGDEFALGSDPRDTDSDDDGLTDGEEVTLGTDPTEPDTDMDGLSDQIEVNFGTDPTDALSPGVSAWVDFNHGGAESGTFNQPYNTLSEGVLNAPVGGVIGLRPGVSSETAIISKPVTIRSFGGSASIGVGAK